jgi:hypothetical protein
MKIVRALALTLLTSALLAACASPLTKNINVDSEYDAAVDFSAIKTYSWLASAQIINDPKGRWEPRGFDADEEIRFLINRELRKRGFTQVETNPDVYEAIWGAVAGDRVESELDVESSKKRLDYAVTTMIKRLPRS